MLNRGMGYSNRKAEFKRFKVYYDKRRPKVDEADRKVCLELKTTGEIIRFSDSEAYDLIIELTKALRWKFQQRRR